MSAVPLALATGPLPGSDASTRVAKSNARSDGGSADFGAVLEEATTKEGPADPVTAPPRRRSEPTLSQAAAAEPASDDGATGTTTSGPETPGLAIAPQATADRSATAMPSVPDAEPNGGTSLSDADPVVAEIVSGQADLKLQQTNAASTPIVLGPVDAAQQPGTDTPPAGASTIGGTPATPPDPDKGEAQAGGDPNKPSATSVEGPQPGRVTTVAPDKPREIATVRPAVIMTNRMGKATAEPGQATPSVDPGSPSADGVAETIAPEIAPLSADPGRVRDVIERATARAGQGQPAAQPTAEASGSAPLGGSGAAADKIAAGPRPMPAPPTGPVPEAAPVVAPTSSVQDPTTLPTPAAVAAEARAAESVADLGLSMTSRASVETTAQIAAQIVRKLEGRSTRFEMALTPEDLGRVDVSLDIDADGSVAARLAFDNPVAATELRGRVDELRRQLQEAGFTVADDAFSFAERDPSSPGHGGAFDRPADRRAGRAFGAAARMAADADGATAPRWIPLTLTPERVDMKV